MSEGMAPAARADSRQVALALVAIAAAAVVAYHTTLNVPILLDDLSTIVANPTLPTTAPAGASWSPPANSTLGGRPLANVSFALNYALHGANVAGYHVVNLAIHVLAALTLFGVVRRTLVGRGAPPPRAVIVAGLAATLWAVHPLCTIAVTYLSQRTESLMGLCYLLTLYGVVRAHYAAVRWPWLVLSVLACVAGVGVKEVIVTAPLLVFLFDRTFLAGSFRGAWQTRRGYYVALGSTWLLLAALMQQNLKLRGVGYDLGVSSFHYALTEAQAVLTYLKLCVWPAPLIFDYGASFATPGLASLLAVVAVLSLLVVAIRLLVVRPVAGFFATSFFILLAPTSSIVPVALQPIAENRAYLPCAIVVTALLVAIPLRFARTTALVGVLAILALTKLTLDRNATYGSALTLWSDTVKKRPENPRARENFAEALVEAGRIDDAIPQYEAALQLNPKSAISHMMFGTALLRTNRLERAAQEFNAALALDPEFTAARSNLAAVAFQRGDYPAAANLYRAVIRAEPTHGFARQNLAITLERMGQPLDSILRELAALPPPTATAEPGPAAKREGAKAR